MLCIEGSALPTLATGYGYLVEEKICLSPTDSVGLSQSRRGKVWDAAINSFVTAAAETRMWSEEKAKVVFFNPVN